ncbi:MAG: MBL fold metallo-hydrolase [Salinigranum sp.]
MLDDRVSTVDTLRPLEPDPKRPQTNEPVSVHVLNDEATVLFGTGFPAGVDRVVEELERVGGLDVIVVEHGDPDHFAALPDLLDVFDATVAIPKQDADALDGVGVEPDVLLGHDEVRWGVRTIHVPGHTPGNMSFLHEDSGTLFVGDTVVHKNSFAAAPGDWSGSLATMKPPLNDDDEKTRENVAILTDYEFDVALLTHGLNVFGNALDEVETLVEDLRR